MTQSKWCLIWRTSVFGFCSTRAFESNEKAYIAFDRAKRILPNVSKVKPGFEIRGVTVADGERYEVRNRVTLCRCGASANKPFCDGAHGDAGFSDS